MYHSSDHTFAVCAYGESEYLQECVNSLLAQTVRTNVIMCTSTPNPGIECVAETAGIPLYVNDAKPGIASDWNFAVSKTSTPLVTIAHQDDVYLPGYAEHALKAFDGVEKPLIFFTNYGELRQGKPVDENRLLRVKRTMLAPLVGGRFKTSRFIRRRILSFGSAICCPSVTMCLPNLPSPVFLDDMRNNLDWEAWERASRLEGAFVYDEEILMRHRIHVSSETSNLISDGTRSKEDLQMLERFWPRPVARAINYFYVKSQKSNSA